MNFAFDLKRFGERLDSKIWELDKELEEQGIIFASKQIEIKLVGQISLLADKFIQTARKTSSFRARM